MVLLDEVDRADQQVWNLFYSPFEKGQMNDGEGKTINFRNTAIFLTSNLGSEAILRWSELRDRQAAAMVEGGGDETVDLPEEQLSFEAITEYLKDEAAKVFTMPLLARMTLLPFVPLNRQALQEIVGLKLARMQRRLAEQRRLELSWDDGLPTWIVDRCDAAGFGARLIDQIIQTEMQPRLTDQLLQAVARGESPRRVWVGLDGGADAAELGIEVS